MPLRPLRSDQTRPWRGCGATKKELCARHSAPSLPLPHKAPHAAPGAPHSQGGRADARLTAAGCAQRLLSRAQCVCVGGPAEEESYFGETRLSAE